MMKVIDSVWLKANFKYDSMTGVFTCAHTGLVATRFEHNNGYNLLHHPVQQAIRANRAAFVYMGLPVPDIVDHRNRNRADDSWSNLRPATAQMNVLNSKQLSTNKSGVKGISWCKHTSSWEVKLQEKRLGRSTDFFEACCLRKSAEFKLKQSIGLI